jgi:hypothetical protein
MLNEVLRFFGITTLIIGTIHAQVAASYPPQMLKGATRLQSVYYFVFAFSMIQVMPANHVMVKLHAGVVFLLGLLFLFAPRLVNTTNKLALKQNKKNKKKD